MTPERYSALVLMRSPGGRGAGGSEEEFTAATMGDATPDPAAVERTRRFFAARGFEVGPLVGISFSISASRRQMELQFEDFERSRGGGEVSLDGLPPEIRGMVRAIATETPPDFGPGSP